MSTRPRPRPRQLRPRHPHQPHPTRIRLDRKWFLRGKKRRIMFFFFFSGNFVCLFFLFLDFFRDQLTFTFQFFGGSGSTTISTWVHLRLRGAALLCLFIRYYFFLTQNLLLIICFIWSGNFKFFADSFLFFYLN